MNILATARWRPLMAAAPRILRALTLLICAIAIVLLFKLARQVDWAAVLQAARSIPGTALAVAGCLSVAGYAAYAGIDFLARTFLRHTQTAWKTLAIAAASYAFNLNLGVLLGGVGIRLRLYRKLGLSHTSTARVVVFGTITNWLGYCWMGSIFFFSDVSQTLTQWNIPSVISRTAGAALLATALGYLLICAGGRHRRTFLGRRFRVPSIWMAMAQSGLAVASWNIIGLVIYVLLSGRISYSEILGVTLFSSVAVLVARIPGGLGVTEAVFVSALAGSIPAHEVLAAILVYRALYQWIPLGIALPAYATAEFRSRRDSCRQDAHFSREEDHEP